MSDEHPAHRGHLYGGAYARAAAMAAGDPDWMNATGGDLEPIPDPMVTHYLVIRLRARPRPHGRQPLSIMRQAYIDAGKEFGLDFGDVLIPGDKTHGFFGTPLGAARTAVENIFETMLDGPIKAIKARGGMTPDARRRVRSPADIETDQHLARARRAQQIVTRFKKEHPDAQL